LASIAGSGCPSLSQGGGVGGAAETGVVIDGTPCRSCGRPVTARSMVVASASGGGDEGEGAEAGRGKGKGNGERG
jgi:hypothetical protein